MLGLPPWHNNRYLCDMTGLPMLDTDNEAKIAIFEKIVVRIKELFVEGLESAVQVEQLF